MTKAQSPRWKEKMKGDLENGSVCEQRGVVGDVGGCGEP